MSYETFGLWLAATALSAIRITCAVRLCPAFSESLLTGMARRLVILVLTLMVVPMVKAQWSALPSGPMWAFLAVKEAVLGTCFGFLAAIPFRVIEVAGNLMDNQRGATMGEIFSPMSESQAAPLAEFLTQCWIALFYLSGAVLLFLTALFESYRLFPVVSGIQFTAALPQLALGSVDALMGLAVIISAPVIIVMVLATLGLGLVNRSAPQLNVFFLSMPIKSALGILVLILSLRLMMDRLFGESLSELLQTLSQWIQTEASNG